MPQRRPTVIWTAEGLAGYQVAKRNPAPGKDHAPGWRRSPDGARNRGAFEMKDDIVIVSAARTPVGAFNGAFASLPAHELGKVAIKAALERAGVEARRCPKSSWGRS